MGGLTEYYNNSVSNSNESNTTSVEPDTVSVDIAPLGREIGAQAAGYGLSQTPISSIPGISGAIGGAVNTGIRGGNATQVGQSAIQGGVTSILNNVLPGLAPLPTIIGATAAELLSEKPDTSVAATKAAISSLGAIAGAAAIPVPVLGPMIGSALANYYGDKSMKDGVLGDLNDVRSREAARDRVESYNIGYDNTAAMARADEGTAPSRNTDFGLDTSGGYSFGLTSADEATTQGQMNKSFEDSFGVEKFDKTLSNFYSRVESMMSESDNGATGSNDGNNTGGGDGNDNDSGAGGGTGSSGDGSGGTGANGGEDGGASDGNDW